MMDLEIENTLRKILDQRIMFFDGAMGTMVQSYSLKEEDFRAQRFHEHSILLKGNNDLLVLTQPKIVEEIHWKYLEAGADIISTNTFNATRTSQKDYELDHLAYEINVAAATP